MSLKTKLGDGFSKLKSSRKIQIYLGIAVVAVVVVVGGIVVANNNAQREEIVQEVVQTYTIPENEKIFINGVIVPKKSKQIEAPTNGAVPDIRVSNGQKVKKGDVLYIAKDEIAISEITSIQAQIKSLIKEKRALEDEDPLLPSINSQITQLNTSLSTANAKAYTKIKAPFDGKVYLASEEQSDGPHAGGLMTLQTTDYVMNGLVSEQDLSKVKQDMTADVTVLSTGETLKGRISYIAERPSTSTPSSEMVGGEGPAAMSFYSVTLSFESQDGIIDGYHTQAVIEVNTDKHKVPSTAIINNGSEVYVLAEIDGFLRKIDVEVLSDNENYAVVAGNLNQDDIIVKNPTKNMKDGDPIPGEEDVPPVQDDDSEQVEN